MFRSQSIVDLFVCEHEKTQTIFPIEFLFGEYVTDHCFKNSVDFRKNRRWLKYSIYFKTLFKQFCDRFYNENHQGNVIESKWQVFRRYTQVLTSSVTVTSPVPKREVLRSNLAGSILSEVYKNSFSFCAFFFLSFRVDTSPFGELNGVTSHFFFLSLISSVYEKWTCGILQTPRHGINPNT